MESPSPKQNYRKGDRVISKLSGRLYWPAQVFEKHAGPSDEYCVVLFGSDRIAYVESGSMCQFNEDNAKKFSPRSLKLKNTETEAQYQRAVEECAANVTFRVVVLGNIPSGSLQEQANANKPVQENDLEETPGSSGCGNKPSSQIGREIKLKSMSTECDLENSLTPSKASPPILKTASMDLVVEPSGVKKRKASSDEPAEEEEEPTKRIVLEKDDGTSGGSRKVLRIQPPGVNMSLTHCSQIQVPAQLRSKEEVMMPLQDQLIGSAPSTSQQQHPLPKSLDAIASVVTGASAKNPGVAKPKVFEGPSPPVLPAAASVAASNKQVSQVSQEGPMDSSPSVKELNGSEEVTKIEMQPGPSRESIRKEPESVVKRATKSVSGGSKSDKASGSKTSQVESPKIPTFGATVTMKIDPVTKQLSSQAPDVVDTGSSVSVGDRVFAKVVGFPYWPAQVTEKTSEDDFQVRFFGTHETDFVKSNALCPYNQASIEKHTWIISKKKKRTLLKKFRKALAECDSDVTFLRDDPSSVGGGGVPGSAISVVPPVSFFGSGVKVEMEKNVTEDGDNRGGLEIKPKNPLNEYLEGAINSSLFSVKTSKVEVVKTEVSARGVNKKQGPSPSKKVSIEMDLSTSSISIPTTLKSHSCSASIKVAANTNAVTGNKPVILHIKPSTSTSRRLPSNDSPSAASPQFGWKEEALKPFQDKFKRLCEHMDFLQNGEKNGKAKGQDPMIMSPIINEELAASSFPLLDVTPKDKELHDEREQGTPELAGKEVVKGKRQEAPPSQPKVEAVKENPEEIIQEVSSREQKPQDQQGEVEKVIQVVPETGQKDKSEPEKVEELGVTPRASAATNVKASAAATKRARAESLKTAEVALTRTHLRRRVELPKRYHDSLVTITKDYTPKSPLSLKKIVSVGGKGIKSSSTSTADQSNKSPAAPVNAGSEETNPAPSIGVASEEDSEEQARAMSK